MINKVNVLSGYCALRLGKYWIGIVEGNEFCKNYRRTSKAALKDASQLYNRRRVKQK